MSLGIGGRRSSLWICSLAWWRWRMASRLSENHDQTYSKQPPMRIVSMCIYRSRCFSLYLLYTKRIWELSRRNNLFHNVSLFGQTSGTVLKKSVFNRTHRYIPHMIYHEDYLLIQVCCLIAPVFYCGIPLNKYRGDVPGQTTQNPNTPQAEDPNWCITISVWKIACG